MRHLRGKMCGLLRRRVDARTTLEPSERLNTGMKFAFAGDEVHWCGESETRSNGYRLLHGAKGEVAGGATFEGYIGEMMSFTSALDDSEVTSLVTALTDKWASGSSVGGCSTCVQAATPASGQGGEASGQAASAPDRKSDAPILVSWDQPGDCPGSAARPARGCQFQIPAEKKNVAGYRAT